MSINSDIQRQWLRLTKGQGKNVVEVRMSAQTLGHLADELRKRPSFNNAYKVPATMTDRVKDLVVNVAPDENHLESSWVASEMKRETERQKIVEKMVPTAMRFSGTQFPIVVDEALKGDDEFKLVCGTVEETIDFKTGRKVNVVHPER